MILLTILIFLLVFCVGGNLKVAIGGKSRGLASIAGWLLLASPVLVLLTILVKHDGPIFWFTMQGWWFSPIFTVPLALLYLLVVPIRSAWRRARIHRDEAILLERSRVLDPDSWAGLGYQELADKLNVKAVPIHMSMDVTTGYAIGFPARRIVIPAAWVPPEVRGLEDEYWYDVDERNLTPVEVRAILAHELAHHRDLAGMRGILTELAGYLFPWEFVAGLATNYEDEGIGAGLASPKAEGRKALSVLSQMLAKVGRVLWRGAIDAERTRQERVADEEAARVFPLAKLLIETMRGFGYSNPPGQVGRFVQSLTLASGAVILALGLTALPGREALPRILGGESAIPWHLPVGWSVGDLKPPLRVSHAGFLPANRGNRERIRVENETPLLCQDWDVAVVVARIIFPKGVMSIPNGARLRVDWPVTYHGSWQTWIRRPELKNDQLLVRFTNERATGSPMKLLVSEFEDHCVLIPAGRNRQIVRLDWDNWTETPLEQMKLDLGMRLFGDAAGVYDIEPPSVFLVCPGGETYELDPKGSGHFIRKA